MISLLYSQKVHQTIVSVREDTSRSMSSADQFHHYAYQMPLYWSQDFGVVEQAFGKNLAGACRVVTKEATNLHQKSKAFSNAGEILEGTPIPAMHTVGTVSTDGASSFGCFHRERQGDEPWR